MAAAAYLRSISVTTHGFIGQNQVRESSWYQQIDADLRKNAKIENTWDLLMTSPWSLASNMTPPFHSEVIPIMNEPLRFLTFLIECRLTSRSMQLCYDPWGPCDDDAIPRLSLLAWVVTLQWLWIQLAYRGGFGRRIAIRKWLTSWRPRLGPIGIA